MSDVDRHELHRRLEILREKLEAGKLHFAPHLIDDFRRSLAAVRLDEAGIVIPETVDSRVRSLSLGIAVQHDREETKQAVQLPDVQAAYFRLVESLFGELHRMMLESHATPHQMASWFSDHEEHIVKNHDLFMEFVEAIRTFWKDAAEPTWAHTEDRPDLKGVFAGEVFPHPSRNPAAIAGLYLDTVILPDPFLKMYPILQLSDKKKRVYEIVRLALQVLEYKELALADISPPIVVVYPDKHHLEEWYRLTIHAVAEQDAVEHASIMFGRSFGTPEEVAEYVKTLATPEEVAAVLRRPELMLFDASWTDKPEEQIRRYVNGEGALLPAKTVGEAVWMHTVSRMSQAADIVRRSLDIHGVPLVQAETSWRWFNWKLDLGSLRDTTAAGKLHMVRALETAAEGKLKWLGNIPADALIAIRKADALPEIRTILSRGVTELAEAKPDDFGRSADAVVANLNVAFDQHQKAIDDLSTRGIKFAGKDIGSFLVVGGIEVAAALSGLPLFGLASAAAGLSGLIPTAKELRERYRELKAERKKLASSATGLLFQLAGASGGRHGAA